jgi:hypothetical protein
LIVDGFDRVLQGSWSEPTHDFAGRLGAALPDGFSVASNEAVMEGRVSLSDYPRVLWMLGDEGVADYTFEADERALIEDYLSGGGDLIVSGSEVGYATDGPWLSSVLHMTFVADDAEATQAGGFTFGVAYEEDYPDVLSSQTVIWEYSGGGAAACGYEGQIIVVGFPLETISDDELPQALSDLADWLES